MSFRVRVRVRVRGLVLGPLDPWAIWLPGSLGTPRPTVATTLTVNVSTTPVYLEYTPGAATAACGVGGAKIPF